MTADRVEKAKMGLEILDRIYDAAITGLPNSGTAFELAQKYLRKADNDAEKAANRMIRAQMIKCAASGFVTGLGGWITLPVAVPADVAGNAYVRLRMIAAVAVMGGRDPYDDEVKALAYVILVGVSAGDIIKNIGVIKGADASVKQVMNKVPKKVLDKMNQKSGLRFITGFKEKGLLNLVKLVPIAGGCVSAVFDWQTTQNIAQRAKNLFIPKKKSK